MQKKVFIKGQRGAAAVEFAIVLPLLVVFLFGIIEFGIVLYNKAIITNASREGARFAILYGADENGAIYKPATGLTGSVESVVKGYCLNHLINFSNSALVNVTMGSPDPSGAPPDRSRTVRVSYSYQWLLIPGFVPLPDTIALDAETQMRTEYQE